LTGRENTTTGAILQGFMSGNSVLIWDYANRYPAVSGSTILMSGVFEATS
jgi:hypothetical protein